MAVVIEIKHIVGIVILLAVIESGLILLGAVPSISTYSPINLFFLVARLGIVITTGWIFYHRGIKNAAINGAILSGTSTVIFLVAIILGQFIHVPVLGIPAPNLLSILVILLVNIIISLLLGSILSVIGAFFGQHFRAKKPFATKIATNLKKRSKTKRKPQKAEEESVQ
jgi:hypothetical protein